MAEINLLDTLPVVRRDVKTRREQKTPQDRIIARKFGREFFDGERRHGYGGYHYDGRWMPVARRLVEHYCLSPDARILDVGAAKGFLMYDFLQVLPGATVRGLDVSAYAKENAYDGMGRLIDVGSAERLPYEDDSFDLVLSINTLHNLPMEKCKRSLREIERVCRGHSYITVDAWRNEEQRRSLLDWVLTAETYMSVDNWHRLFGQVGYTGDCWWFIP